MVTYALDAVSSYPRDFNGLNEVFEFDHAHAPLLGWCVHLICVDPIDILNEVVDCSFNGFQLFVGERTVLT